MPNEKSELEKHLVMFSPNARSTIVKNDINYLNSNDYNLQDMPDYGNDPKYRVWGLPNYSIGSAPVVGLLGGVGLVSSINSLMKRPIFANLHLHALSVLAIGFIVSAGYRLKDHLAVEKQLITWDYVRKHPEDFPEVYNKPKKYADVLKAWSPNR